MARDFRTRLELHGWAALGYAGLYCGVVLGETLSQTGRLAALGMGVLGVVATLRTFLNLGPMPTLRENILAFVQWVKEAKLGANAALVTIGLIAAAQAAAAVIGERDSEVRVGAANGLQMATFMLLLAYVWRLRMPWRIAAIAAWAVLDLAAYASMGGMHEHPTRGNGLMTLVVGTPMAWLLLALQDALDPERTNGSTV